MFCQLCTRAFASFAGLQVHRAAKHKLEYNEALNDRKQVPIGEVELREMARIEAANEATWSFPNKWLHSHHFPTRSCNMISKMRHKPQYLQFLEEERTLLAPVQVVEPLVEEETIEGEPQEPVGIPNVQQAIDGHYRKAAMVALRGWIESAGINSTVRGYAMNAMNGVDTWKETKETLLKPESKTVTCNRPLYRGDRPGPRHNHRRKNHKFRKYFKYKKIQEAYARDRKNTIKKVLNGTFYDEKPRIAHL